MTGTIIAGSILGIAVGTAAAYGKKNQEWTKRIHFVERDKLESELDELDIDVDEGETCAECGRSIDPKDIGLVFQHEDQYKVVCDRAECLDTYDIND